MIEFTSASLLQCHHPRHASLSAPFMVYLFGELEVMLGRSASTGHVTNYYP
jgi:hypothetical protein